MKQRSVDEFLQKIAPHRDLWRSVHLVGYAGLIGNKWILLAGRAVLSPKSVATRPTRSLVELPEFSAYISEFPSSDLDQVLKIIAETECLRLKLADNTFRDMHLQADANSVVQWFSPARFDRSWKSALGLEGVGFQWTVQNSFQVSQIGALELLNRASEHLRLASDIDGVEALSARHTPGLLLNELLIPKLQVLAPLPFVLKCTGGRAVCLTIPETANPLHIRLKAFFRPSGKPTERQVSLEEYPQDGGAFTIRWDPEWPATATSGDIRLFYRGGEVDSLVVNRWAASATVRGAIDEYFDAEHKKLERALAWQDRSKSDDFELAVVRLLNLLGLPAVWYGKTVDPDRPDAAAVLTAEDSSSIVLLVECTRERPAAKFSGLAQRARQLGDLTGNGATVVPIVFTPAHVSDTDTIAAAEYGICLIGADQLGHLFALLRSRDTEPPHVLQYFRERTAVHAAERFIGRW